VVGDASAGSLVDDHGHQRDRIAPALERAAGSAAMAVGTAHRLRCSQLGLNCRRANATRALVARGGGFEVALESAAAYPGTSWPVNRRDTSRGGCRRVTHDGGGTCSGRGSTHRPACVPERIRLPLPGVSAETQGSPARLDRRTTDRPARTNDRPSPPDRSERPPAPARPARRIHRSTLPSPRTTDRSWSASPSRSSSSPWSSSG